MLARPAPTSGRVLVQALFVFVVQACGAGWHRPGDLAPGALPARQQVQIWHQGRVQRWHAVAITPDSVSGIPYLSSVDCASCRVSLLRSGVDSLRMGDPVAGLWRTVGLVVGIPLVAFAILCASHPGGPPCSD
jgi:hypothetical protein